MPLLRNDSKVNSNPDTLDWVWHSTAELTNSKQVQSADDMVVDIFYLQHIISYKKVVILGPSTNFSTHPLILMTKASFGWGGT